ncbi:WbqC family protein [Gammaproteobacteria bacterium]|nr:WbqC family protein [Gammaproteobacteria bacterium]
MQPYFFPYFPYWQLIYAADKFIIFDDVNYKKKGFINRNYISSHGFKKFFTLELVGASQNKLISDIKIGKNRDLLLKRIAHDYKNAPFYDLAFPIIETIFKHDEENLARFLAFSMSTICRYLEISTPVINSSSLNKKADLKGASKVLGICKLLNADYYINPIGGLQLYNTNFFESQSVKLQFLKAGDLTFKGPTGFDQNISILEILLYNDVSTIKNALPNYSLIEV